MLTGEVIWNAAEEGCAAGVRTAAGDGGESEAGVQRERGRSGVGGELVAAEPGERAAGGVRGGGGGSAGRDDSAGG